MALFYKRFYISAITFLLIVVGVQAQVRDIPVYTQPPIKNYVRTWEAVAPITDAGSISVATPITQARMTTQYLDGLGRPLQIVSKGVAPNGGDLVAPIEYDEYGREQFKYLSYVSNINNGLFKDNPFIEQ